MYNSVHDKSTARLLKLGFLLSVVGVLGTGIFLLSKLNSTEKALEEQRLIRLVEPVMMPFAENGQPDQYLYDTGDELLWFCYHFARRTPTGSALIDCKLEPSIELSSLNQQVDETEDDRDIFHALIMIYRGYKEKSPEGDGGYKVVNEILGGKKIHVTVYGFDSGDEHILPLHPEEPGKGRGMDNNKTYEKVVTMRFDVEISSEALRSRDGTERMPLRKYSKPTFEFHK